MNIRTEEVNAKDYELIIQRIDNMVESMRRLRSFVELMYNRSIRISNWEEALMADIIDPKESAIACRTVNILKYADCYDMRIMQFLHTISHRHIKDYRGAGSAIIKFIQQKIKFHTGYDWDIKTDKDIDRRFISLYK